MKSIASALALLASTVVVNAHFQMQFPAPRGPFVEDDEPNFCDGFTNATTNRTQFPLSGGIVEINSEHSSWSAAFYISSDSNPNSFNDFQQVNSFFKDQGEGKFCLPLNLASSNFTGLQSGQNVTLQMLFDGGDGNLFQCADLTLTNDNSSISSLNCQNSTSGSGSNSTSGSGSNSSALGVAATLNVKVLTLLGAASLIPALLA
ncbi:hypothetical protein AN958_12078 [Leucoagaricus sp. SymC.cos]|nr:hypothetical protein AN958_12078 [Leucoagaricus sp. SymC.cos]